MCRGVISGAAARGEAMKRAEPELYERRKAEAYVVGGGNPAPAVVTFTTELACMAVNEMIQRLQGSAARTDRSRTVSGSFTWGRPAPASRPRPACPVCAADESWGRGDTDPFLGRVA